MRYVLPTSMRAKTLGQITAFYSPFSYFVFSPNAYFIAGNFCVETSYARSILGFVARVHRDLGVGRFVVLHVKGIGFKVYYNKHNHALYLLLGYNHITKFLLPSSIIIKVRKQYILMFSYDSSSLGKYVSLLCSLRTPDPYRGKGIRYRYQIIKFKPGKQR